MLEISEESKRNRRFHVFRFEELLSSPREQMKKVFNCCELDMAAITYLRQVEKQAMGKDGKRRINSASILRRVAPNHFQKLVWLPIEKLSEMFVHNINTNQICICIND